MKSISPSETEITGNWLISEGRVTADENCARIFDLTKEYLVELDRDSSGWDTLYRDPKDGRLWELIYPHSELHGGGPPLLRCLSKNEAETKYKLT